VEVRSYYQSHQSGIETGEKIIIISPAVPTNRTNLELKREFYFRPGEVQSTTNRTNLELKPKNKNSNLEGGGATNRTNLELKLARYSDIFLGSPLPIAPIWN